jgi:hypothetical protein
MTFFPRVFSVEIRTWRLTLATLATLASNAAAANAPALPDWTEVQSVVRSNLTGLSAEDWNRVQVQGLLDQLRSEVVLVGNETPTAGPSLARSEVIEEICLYLKIARVDAGLDAALGEAVEKARATNRLQGVVLDLRFASGSDYEAAARVADRFIGKEIDLLDWAGQMARATASTQDVDVPVAVLVNAQTSGAPEALAEVMRESKAGLILGAPTAGRAFVFRDFTLSGGQTLRIASAKVRLASGNTMPSSGVKPDIAVTVRETDERAYYDNPWSPIAREPQAVKAAAGTTNSVSRRLNEAELMRQRREETGDREPEPARVKAASPVKPTLQDPALARAIDLLKGLAILRQSQLR